MSFSRISSLLLLLCTPLWALAQNGQHDSFDPSKATYLWPTDASPYLTSTFAETRSAHFHSALDLKTWGRKGYKVFATRDGIVHRIAIGPTGYGKVLYLKHDDGSFSVYAHLLRFEKEIQQLADSIRFEDYSFEIDRNVENLNFRVKQGDVIGLSGASGIGPPHLHFELRTPKHDPFNPLLTNLKIEDTIAPKFSHLSIEPLSFESEIEGQNQIITKRTWKSNGNYTFGTIDISGPIGLGVNVFDQANGVYNAYAVYELKLFVDDSLHFYSKADQFSYFETNQMFVDRVYPLLQKYNAGYQRLYIKDGNTLPFYERNNGNAKLRLEPGIHNITIIAKDYYGNERQLNGTLRVSSVNTETSKNKRVSSKKDLTKFDPSQWSWFDDWVNIPVDQAKNLTIATSDYSIFNYDTNSLQLNLAQKENIFFRGSYKKHFHSRRVSATSLNFITSTTDQSFARFDKDSFYYPISTGLFVQHIQRDSIRIEVMPVSQPIKATFQLAVALDSVQQKLPKLSVYSFNKRKQKLSYLESRHADKYIMAEPDQLGTFFVLQDTTTPSLAAPKLHEREDGQWLIYIEAKDDLSGVDFKTAKITVNGTRGIAEFEPEDKRLVYYHPDFKPTKEMSIAVSVSDMEGNSTQKTFQLTAESF